MEVLDREMIHSGTCADAFARMFWAFPFFIDFRIGFNDMHIDVLPDLIGWIIMATAIGWILKLHPDVKTIRTLTFWLIFLSIFDIIEFRKQVKGFSINISITPFTIIKTIAEILAIIVIWKLCGVIMDIAIQVNNTLIARRADFRRKLYIGFIIAAIASAGIILIMPHFIFIMLIVGLPLAIIVLCLLMGLMKGTATMCRAGANVIMDSE